MDMLWNSIGSCISYPYSAHVFASSDFQSRVSAAHASNQSSVPLHPFLPSPLPFGSER